MDPSALAVQRKVAQKNEIARGVREAGAADDDLIIVSDLDEIPHAPVIQQLKECTGWTSPVEIQSANFMYDFGCQPRGAGWTADWLGGWRKSKLLFARELEVECDGWWDGQLCVDELRDPQQLRLGLFRWPTGIQLGGVHMSYFMETWQVAQNSTPAHHLHPACHPLFRNSTLPWPCSEWQIAEKLGSISHIERDTAEYRNADFIECLVAECRHINGKEQASRSSNVARGLRWTWEEAYLRGNQTYLQYYERPLKRDACAK